MVAAIPLFLVASVGVIAFMVGIYLFYPEEDLKQAKHKRDVSTGVYCKHAYAGSSYLCSNCGRYGGRNGVSDFPYIREAD